MINNKFTAIQFIAYIRVCCMVPIDEELHNLLKGIVENVICWVMNVVYCLMEYVGNNDIVIVPPVHYMGQTYVSKLLDRLTNSTSITTSPS